MNTSRFWVLVGGSEGITSLQLDTSAGTLQPHGIVCSAPANFMAIAPDETFLCGTATFTDDAKKHQSSEVFSAGIDRKVGTVKLLDREPSHGAGSCYVTIDPLAKFALVANYSSATVAVFPLAANGELGAASCVVTQTGSSVDPDRQKHAYAHSVNLDPTSRYAFVADLGADKLFSYRFDHDTGQLTPNDPPSIATPPGSGPRHFTFDRSGRFCYLVTEMGGTVIAYRYDKSAGTMSSFQQCSLLPKDYKGTNSSAEVQIDPSGKFLYASDRIKSDMLAIFSIDPNSGMLTSVGFQSTLGKTPRHFRIDPTGQFLIAANQDSDNIVLFRIDRDRGTLAPVGAPIEIKKPQCVKYVSMPD